MYNNKVENNIKNLFIEINEKVKEIITDSKDSSIATQSIMDYVSSKITAASRGYMTDIYASLSKQTLSEDMFQDSENANKFYELNLRQQIFDAYQFDINDLATYKSGIGYKEINRIYASLGVAVGTLSLGGILRAALTKSLNIPLVVIIAGAVILGVGTYLQAVPEYNRAKYNASVDAFISEIEKELLLWVEAVEEFFKQQVTTLKMTL